MSALNKLADSVVDRIEHTTALDRFATPLASAVSDLFGRSGLKDVFSGSWFGHPLHPLLTDLPIGSWTSAMVLDFVGGRRAAAGRRCPRSRWDRHRSPDRGHRSVRLVGSRRRRSADRARPRDGQQHRRRVLRRIAGRPPPWPSACRRHSRCRRSDGRDCGRVPRWPSRVPPRRRGRPHHLRRRTDRVGHGRRRGRAGRR